MKLVQGELRSEEREVTKNCEKEVEMVVGEMVRSDGREERGKGEGGFSRLLGWGRISTNAPHIIPRALLIP